MMVNRLDPAVDFESPLNCFILLNVCFPFVPVVIGWPANEKKIFVLLSAPYVFPSKVPVIFLIITAVYDSS